MTEKSYLDHVGHVLFPRTPADLTSMNHCPACFTALTSTVCTVCALDVSNPLAVDLRAASLDAVASLDRRLEIIGQIRFESAQGDTAVAAPAAASAVAAVSTVVAPPVAPPVPVPAPADAPPTAPLVSVPPAVPAADAAPRRHFGVQVILLIVGVSLLSVGAIFFLVYAFITFGLVWRSVIILAVTLAAFVSASLLKRRKLGATAEAIGALAVVFVYLDAFALRANDLFGAGASDALTYWGIVLLLSAVGFFAWHRWSGLRIASIVGFTAFAPGLALLIAGLTEPLHDGTRIFAAFIALAVGGLVHPFAASRIAATAPVTGEPRRTVERVIVLALAVVGVIGAAISAQWLDQDSDWAPAYGLAAVAVVAVIHVAVLDRVAALRPFALIFAGVAGFTAASAVAAAGIRVNDAGFMVLAPVVASAVVALVLELLARRLTRPVAKSGAVVSAWTAAGVAALLALVPVVTALIPLFSVLGLASPRWGYPGSYLSYLRSENYTAILALALVIVVIAGFWAISRTLSARRAVIGWAIAAVLVLAAPVLGLLAAVVAAWLVMAAAAVVLLILGRGWSVALRIPIALGGIVALALGYTSSWASADTWVIGSIAAIALLLVARLAHPAAPLRAVLLAAAMILAFVAIGSGAQYLNLYYVGGDGQALDATHAVGGLAIVFIAVAAVLRRGVSVVDTRVVYWLSFGTAVVTSGMSWLMGAIGGAGSLVLSEFGTSVVLAIALLVALLGWVLLPSTSTFVVERIAASISLAPAAAWLANSLTRLLDLPDFANTIAPISAALLVAAGSLGIALLRAEPGHRWARETGVAIVAIPAVLGTIVARPDAAWLVLLLAAVTALLVAVARDGLVGSSSPRKHLGWLALALATSGLWWRLADAEVPDLEPYVLPLAGVLLLVALFDWRATRANRSAPYIALAGLLAAIVPVAVAGTVGDGSTRAIVIVAASALLLLVGSWVPGSAALRPYLDVAAIAGAAGVAIGAFGRALSLIASVDRGDIVIDLWAIAGFALLVVGAVGQARLDGRGPRSVVSQAGLAVALGGLMLVEIPLIDASSLGTTRSLALTLVLCAVHVASFLIDRAPFTRVIAWVAIGSAGLVGVIALSRDAFPEVEWMTLPIAAALLLTGAWQLHRTPTARSWAWLAPGLGVLLLPSLVATFVEQPVWRLVALGVACIAAIVLGALGKLQAPLLIGSVVVLIHGLRTFAPAIRAVYELTEWWIWAVVGGAIVLFLGLTFEKRVRDLKSVTTRVSGLR